MSERDDVVAWLSSAVGWKFAKMDSKPGGKSIYEFWEDDGGGWHLVHKMRADQLRWRFVMGIGLEHIPELRAKRDAIWAEYLAGRAVRAGA